MGPHPTGTGVIDSFLRVQQKGAEEGFNTGARPMMCDGRTCDDKVDPNFTRNLLSSDVPVVTINGQKYREFFLDINEPGSTPGNYLTLDAVEIYVSNSASLDTHTSTSPGYGVLSGASKVYDMETNNGDNWVNMDYNLVGGGSGWAIWCCSFPIARRSRTISYVYSILNSMQPVISAKSCGSGKYQSQAGSRNGGCRAPTQRRNRSRSGAATLIFPARASAFRPPLLPAPIGKSTVGRLGALTSHGIHVRHRERLFVFAALAVFAFVHSRSEGSDRRHVSARTVFR